ncbi:hypothetical protein EW146_g5816 [Bondarzewia mesenterica]|uniref:Ty3 transposon capsid-like protein domain-containing protein n=1 Tax=Bondarzewia mesenterica TaxID=1095465 RepID=A0A4S4LW18_9AGAM|nr:hypothetical protein EW146_g5816 [Bondarzewia mesenterica]
MTSTNDKLPDLAKPTLFSGNRADTKHFLAQCNLYMKARAKNFDDDYAKIAFVLSFMKGGLAKQWAMDYTDILATAPKTTYADFKKALRAVFEELNPERNAVVRLKRLVQGKYSVQAYIATFKELALKAKYTGTPLIEEFKRGLDRKIIERILLRDNPPEKIKDWYKHATTYDDLFWNYTTEVANHNGRGKIEYPNRYQSWDTQCPFTTNRYAPAPNQRFAPPNNNDQVIPMDVDKSAFRKLDPRERADL